MSLKPRFLLLVVLALAGCGTLGRAVVGPVGGRLPAAVPGDLQSAAAGPQVIPLAAGHGARRGSFEVYFTDPESPLADQLTGGLDGPLVDALDSARLSIDMAAYRLDSFPIRVALLHAQARGVRLRLVMEGDDLDGWDALALLEAGVPIVGDWPDGLMHDKFVIIDGTEVWTGSANFTSSGIYQDHNNFVRINSPELARLYTDEFEEMYLDRHFGPIAASGGTGTGFLIDDVPVHAYFAPEDQVAARLVSLISSAKEHIYFLAFSFTSDALGDALRGQARHGITVQGVMDADQVRSNQGSEYDAFRQAGLTVLADASPGQMHHKVMIIDGAVVVTGSYNFTASAERRNDENLLVIEDADLATLYLAEFRRLFTAAQP